jgi:hypothetical protein
MKKEDVTPEDFEVLDTKYPGVREYLEELERGDHFPANLGEGDLMDDDFKTMKACGFNPFDLTDKLDQERFVKYLKDNP